MSARVQTAFALLVGALFFGFAMRGTDNPIGWPDWVGLIGLVLAAQAVRMLYVECRSPWQSGGAR